MHGRVTFGDKRKTKHIWTWMHGSGGNGGLGYFFSLASIFCWDLETSLLAESKNGKSLDVQR